MAGAFRGPQVVSARPLHREQHRARLEAVHASLTMDRASPAVAVPRRVGVLGFAGVGGSGKVAAETASGLHDMGHQVDYLSAPDSAFAPTGPRLVELPMPREPEPADAVWVEELAGALAEYLSRAALDVMFVHYVTGNLEAALRARARAKVRTRIVAVLHGSDVTRFGQMPPQADRMRDALVAADEVIAVSVWLADQARDSLGVGRTIAVVDNAVDVDLFRPGRWSAAARAEIAPTKSLLLGHVSNMRSVKRAGDAIETLAELRGAGLEARLLMVGEGPDMDDLRARALRRDVAGCVELVGAVSPAKLPTLVAACDLTLVTSTSESFSLVAMESMACGVPVVSTRCGGLERAMNRLVSVGGVAPVTVGAPRELAMGVRSLWFEPDRYRAVSLSGLRMAIEDFPRQRQLAAYAELVERA